MRLSGVSRISVAMACAVALGACSSGDVRELPASVGRERVIAVTNLSSSAIVSTSLAVPTNVVYVCRQGVEVPVCLERGESCVQMLSATATGKVFLLIGHGFRNVPNAATGMRALGYDYSRLVGLWIPPPTVPLSELRAIDLFHMTNLHIRGMSSWVSDLIDASPEGTRLTVRRAIPERTRDGTVWTNVVMAYDVLDGTFMPLAAD